MAIAGQALPPAVLLSYGYLAANAGYTRGRRQAQRSGRRCTNLGVIWGLFSVVVIVAGATALHAVYTGAGPSYLGVSHYSQIESIPVAGQVLGPAFPGALGFLAPRFFSLGLIAAAFTTLISVSLTMTYFCLDMARPRLALHRTTTRLFKMVFATWIAVPALVAPFWQLPALLKAILAMVGNLLMAPVAVAVILYFVNQRRARRVQGQRRPQPGARPSPSSSRSASSSTDCGDAAMTAARSRRRRARHRGRRRRGGDAAADGQARPRRRRRAGRRRRTRDRGHDDGAARGGADRGAGRGRCRRTC